ncbi:MAG: hypothetical protein Q7J22_00300 [Candidatus Wolfebacteria bacterium]|nr:hypothetical protein [Candidatus Wolfebacteria bacterium]MDP2704600.1 hypothetical protein [bacterium]
MKHTKEQLLAEKEKLEELLRVYKSELNFGDSGDDADPHGEEADETEEFATYLGVKEVLQKRLNTIQNELRT